MKNKPKLSEYLIFYEVLLFSKELMYNSFIA